mmetsp:Transcript_619/g.1307  ORF Transcript_619/g.1307 Transcript_619/m.1307 type:complete len:278 (+) Transcript_619:487-1320(+)
MHGAVVLHKQQGRPPGAVGFGEGSLQAPRGGQPQDPEIRPARGRVKKGLAAAVAVQLQGLRHPLEEHGEEALRLRREGVHSGNEVEERVAVPRMRLPKVDAVGCIWREVPQQQKRHLGPVEGARVPEHRVPSRVAGPPGHEPPGLDHRPDRAHVPVDDRLPEHVWRGEARLGRRGGAGAAAEAAPWADEALEALGELLEGLLHEGGEADVLKLLSRGTMLEQGLQLPGRQHVGAPPQQRERLVQQRRHHRLRAPRPAVEAQVDAQRASRNGVQAAPR